MKLGKLNAAIDAAPNVFVVFTWGVVALQKGSLKSALKEHHHGQRAAETGLTLSPENVLQWERGA